MLRHKSQSGKGFGASVDPFKDRAVTKQDGVKPYAPAAASVHCSVGSACLTLDKYPYIWFTLPDHNDPGHKS